MEAGRNPNRDQLLAGFFAFEIWKRSGAWSHFPDRHPELVDGALLHRVTRDDALKLRSLLRELLAWTDHATFEEIPGARARIAAQHSEVSELCEARADGAFQKMLRATVSPRGRGAGGR
jgi:hypothetical protein